MPEQHTPIPEDFDPLQAFIDLFADAQATRATSDADRADRTLDQRLRDHIIQGDKEHLSETLDEALAQYPALTIINDHLLDGMKTVGELFGSGQMQLPFVLQSAEVMKQAVALLEPHMDRAEGSTLGTVVLATVKGDVHDIGKNLVDIILTNNGYRVINLGIKQPIAAIKAAIDEHTPDAVGLSGLLVKSVHVMEDNLRDLAASGYATPVMLGGAALSRHHAEGHLASVYPGPCLYGKDAFEGLRLIEHIVDDRLDTIHAEVAKRQATRADSLDKAARTRAAKPAPAATESSTALPTIEPAPSIPSPPFWGTRVTTDLPLDDIYPYINTTALFRGQWQFRKGAQSQEAYDALLADQVEPIFQRVCARLRDEAILQPAAVHGYFPCHSDGNDLIIYDPADHTRPIETISFPRQAGRKNLCIADFFAPVGSGSLDVIAMSCVTMGPAITAHAQQLFDADDYAEYLYAHGLGVEAAEALAELMHQRIRRELGIAHSDSPTIKGLFTQGYQGSRYSFGYPACPDLADQQILWRLLEPQRIGCALTENWQIDPEQSTSALIVHHPQARYFAV